MRYLKTNTATTIVVGPFLDATDGVTPETGLTATNEHATLVVDNAGSPALALDADLTASGGNNDFVHVTNDDAGYYTLELTAAQVNYLGGAELSINYATDHAPVFHEFMILPANVYDSIVSGSDYLQADMVQIEGADATDSLATEASIRAEMDSNSTQLAAIVADTNELQTDWADGGRLDLLLDGASAPTAAQVRAEIDSNSTQLAAIVADTNELQTDWTNGGRLDLIMDELTTQGDTNEGLLHVIDGLIGTPSVDLASDIAGIALGSGMTEAAFLADFLALGYFGE
jgi:hypothetical protein